MNYLCCFGAGPVCGESKHGWLPSLLTVLDIEPGHVCPHSTDVSCTYCVAVNVCSDFQAPLRVSTQKSDNLCSAAARVTERWFQAFELITLLRSLKAQMETGTSAPCLLNIYPFMVTDSQFHKIRTTQYSFPQSALLW